MRGETTMQETHTATNTSEAAIVGRVFTNGKEALAPELARHILALAFSEEDKARMTELATKNQEGAISPEEKEELFNYIKVGDLLALLQSKARKALKKK
jgi:hypothetical protein